ncbi:MAG: endonuclease/exonuclease/phosphatase family protein [Spirochaetia bacterium]
MKTTMKSIIKTLVLVTVIILFLIFLVLAWFTVNDYRPDDVINLDVYGNPAQSRASELTVITWNIGYAGLGEGQDFFLDGGIAVQPSLQEMQENLLGIGTFLEQSEADVFLLQEVDRNSKRTNSLDQVDLLAEAVPGSQMTFAYNYNVPFVPIPPTQPMGRIEAGLYTLSRVRIRQSTRYQLPGSYPWPMNTVHLDRCILVTRHQAPNSREWVVINLHSSAYDASGNLREQQFEFVNNFMQNEYIEGNYVVVGGDWNSLLPGVSPNEFLSAELPPEYLIQIPEHFTPNGWQWCFDQHIPTNRSLAAPYEEGRNFVTIIDGILVSPNIEVIEYETIDMGFSYSDHQPVRAVLSAEE